MRKESKEGKIVYMGNQSAKNNEREKIEVNNDEAILICNGEVIKLDSFILSGLDLDENRVMLMYNTSIDEAILYRETLNISIQNRLRDLLEEDEN